MCICYICIHYLLLNYFFLPKGIRSMDVFIILMRISIIAMITIMIVHFYILSSLALSPSFSCIPSWIQLDQDKVGNCGRKLVYLANLNVCAKRGSNLRIQLIPTNLSRLNVSPVNRVSKIMLMLIQ